MSKIQQTLDALQPYVIGIRYVKNVPVIDIVLAEGWTTINDPLIKITKGDESVNYYMIYSEEPNIGLDECLAYVEKIIKSNRDREKKQELFKSKVNQLKEVFKANSLSNLEKLKFTFIDDGYETSISKFDESIDEEPETPKEEEIVEENIVPEGKLITAPKTYLDENRNPIELSEEDKEILEEEERARLNIKAMGMKKTNISPTPAPRVKRVDLPPKPSEKSNTSGVCDCGPNSACDKCIDSKGY